MNTGMNRVTGSEPGKFYRTNGGRVSKYLSKLLERKRVNKKIFANCRSDEKGTSILSD